MSDVIMFVDPFSSGNLLAQQALKLGFKCVSIFSGEIEQSFLCSYRSEDYIGNLQFDGDYEALLSQAKAYEPLAVIVGCESGVELCDRLAADLGLACNDIDYSEQRRDKYLMQERVKQQGLRSIAQQNCHNAEQVLDFARQQDWPVVIKPLKSAGADNVFICQNEAELVAGCEAILTSNNAFGESNHSVLAQEFIGGQEYAVDSVSMDGRHFVTNVTEIIKEELGNTMVYRQTNFLNPNAPELAAIIKYVHKVLDALGITIGASHCEVKVDENGPVLIEVGARMQGGMVPKVVAEFARHSQTDLCIDAYLRPEQFINNTQQGNENYRHAKVYGMANRTSGVVEQLHLEKVTSLDSYHWGVFLMEKGKLLSQTTSFINCPGWVFLINEDETRLEQDFDNLYQMENGGEIYHLSA